MKTDVCIIGAGPAGLLASIVSAQRGARTVIVEHKTTACRKLLHTGGGRCNLTHTGSVEEFVRSYGNSGRFLKHSLYEFSADDLRQYFAQRGLETKVEKNGCVFPVTDRASDVARVLIDNAQKQSVEFLYGKEVQSIEKEQAGFSVLFNGKKISARAVIIATGGITWPSTGSTGAGYKFARSFGHIIVEPKACLAPLVTAETWLGQLGGVSIENVVIKAKVANRKVQASGPLIFTANGIGGPAVLDLSRLITDYLPDHDNPIKITLDIMPEYEIESLEAQIISLCSKHPKRALAGILAMWLPKSLALNLCNQISPSQTILASSLQKNQRKQIVTMLKRLPLSVVAAGPIAEATVTRGGICTAEVNPRAMESKLHKGLFFAGEVINVDGPCGGFNLQIAFSTGHLAGKTAAGIVGC
ncbi:MAG: NAD(P)/FAD-dependent oxidoreductase [Phycisphaerae bacterium]|nr:NAD(P)/FAD-dependent oxidoreductase [Phycisphaerae bacterium]